MTDGRPRKLNPRNFMRYRILWTLTISLCVLIIPVKGLADEFIATGTYTGNGSNSHAINGLGFQPEFVIVKSANSNYSFAKTKDMIAGEAKNLASNEAAQQGYITALNGDGFTLGPNPEVNETGVEFYWVAMRSRSGALEVGEYTGDGGFFRKVSLSNVTPDAVLVMSGERALAVYRHGDMGYKAYALDGSGEVDNSIAFFIENGFYVSNGESVNKDGDPYYYVAWKAEAQAIEFGSYEGQNSGSQDISSLSINPEYLLIANDSTEPPVHRTASQTGDNSLFFNNASEQSNLIQAMWEGGFQVGTDHSVNAQNSNYYWLAFANPQKLADLMVETSVDNPSPSESETVSITVGARNAGPNEATNVQITDLLPAGLTYVSSIMDQGTYDGISGIWDIGTISHNQSLNLVITATVDVGAAGNTLTCTATVTASDLVDTDTDNNSASAEISVVANSGSDLAITISVDDDTVNEGQSFSYTISVTNHGPDNATNVQINDNLGIFLSLITSVANRGTYDGGTGNWDLGYLNNGETETLTLTASPNASTSGSIISNTAAITALDQSDSNSDNDSYSVDITVNSVDVQIVKLVNDNAPNETSIISYTIAATNLGPGEATFFRISDPLPAGITFVSASASQGTYNESTGVWDIGTVANAISHTLSVSVSVDEGTLGDTISNTASLGNVAQNETNPANNTSTTSITVAPPEEEPTINLLWPVPGYATDVLPGARSREKVLTFAYTNLGSEPDTLHTLTIDNLTEGSGNRLLMDAEWQSLALTYEINTLNSFAAPQELIYQTFTNGQAVFENLEWEISPGDTLNVTVKSNASLESRDSAVLQLGISATSRLEFSQSYTISGGWPLVSGQSLRVDGFVAAQAGVIAQESSLLAIGSHQNLALTVDLPGNGYLSDTLYGLSLKNNGSAQPISDISGMQIWADDGDNTFDTGDTLLGQAIYSGDLWQLTGLNVPVPAAGIRIFTTIDISETAGPSRDIRLSLPVGNGYAVEMYSGNDGPVDVSLENASTLGISVNDRIILSSEWFISGITLPGTKDVPLLQFLLTNTYAEDRQLQSLVFTNTTEAAGATTEQQDATCQQIYLVLDANNNGLLDDVIVDTQLASGIFVNGKAIFTGLDLTLSSDTAVRLFVTADLSLTTVADGNRIKGEIQSLNDVGIARSTVVATWPLNSGAEWIVNGMIADQITNNNISVLTLGPGEGPILAMDFIIPSNGYLADELLGISFSNEGSATPADLLEARLWEDGGDGIFNADAGDDILLGPLTLTGSDWTSTVLSNPIPVGGSHLFTSITVSEAPQDSVTVKLGIPRDGITVSSGMDGPINTSIPGNGNLVISTSPLRTAISFAQAATNTGQSGTITMTLRNAGSDIVSDIEPDVFFHTGSELLTFNAPVPSIIETLDPGAEATFSWEYMSDSPGEVVLEGNAQGMVNGDQIRRSIITPTSAHKIYSPVPGLDLYPTTNLPFSINRGQQSIYPLTLTLINPGGDDVADAELTSLRLRFMESIDGPMIAPAELLNQIMVAEGTNIYFTSSEIDLPSEAIDLDLVFSEPVVITGDEPVTLGIRLDLRLNSTSPSFMISIEDPTWFVSNDAINDNSLIISTGEGSFPIQTGQAMLVSQAVGLNVATNALEDVNTLPGQSNILLAEINLSQSHVDDNSSSIDLGRLAFEFHNAEGIPLENPSQYIDNLSLRSSFQEHFAGPPVVESDSLIVLQLSAPVSISGAAVVTLRLYGNIGIDSPVGQITTLVGPVDYFDARDGNMNNPVPVNFTTGTEGHALNILAPASSLAISGTGLFPDHVSQGTRDLSAMNMTINNPGEEGSSTAVCDTIILGFYNAARQPLAVESYLDRVRILSGPLEYGGVISPVAAEGLVAIPINGLDLYPGQSLDLQIKLDFKPSAPSGTMELVVAAGSIISRDSISGQALEILAADDARFPISSGVATIVIPSDELRVAATSLMPPLLIASDHSSQALSLALTNDAPPGSGGIEINSVMLGEPADKAADQTLGTMLSSLNLLLGETVVASTDIVDESATTVTLTPEPALIIEAGQEIELVIEFVLKESASEGHLSLVLSENGITASPPGGWGQAVRVLPANGYIFPFTTEKGNIGNASLKESYANFPNPFAAGREPTTFAFSLEQEAQINLRILTPHGELVKTILQNEIRSAGFYQNDQWQGFNGNGIAVHNGVFLAELTVQYNDGSKERILRKVAVVR